MSKTFKLLSLVLLLFSFTLAAQTIELSEDKLDELAQKGAPQLSEIESAFLNAAVQTGQVQEKYAPELFGKGAYLETNEEPLTVVMPVFTPIKQAQMGVRKNFVQGVQTTASVVTDQRSSTNPFIGSLQNVTVTTFSFTAQMDLWKNLLGRLSKKEMENAQLNQKRAELEKGIQTRAFMISLRRLYWSLVFNNEALLISEQLLKTASTQLSEAKLRLKNAVAEKDEVARYEAQLASRKGTQLYIEYQKEILLKQLRNLLPELSSKEIKLKNYDLNQTITDVLACTATISQEEKVPYHFTRYDEIISLLKDIKSNSQYLNSGYADPEVKLYGTLRSTGVASEGERGGVIRGNYGRSVSEQLERNLTGYEVGVLFNVPLGDVKESTEKVKTLYDEKRLEASINSTSAQVINTHQQLKKTIALLTEVIRAQKISSRELNTRLEIMKKKYQQARVTVDQLVFDQDALLNSELTTIDTQLQILNTIFDYLMIYTETPCAFNRI